MFCHLQMGWAFQLWLPLCYCHKSNSQISMNDYWNDLLLMTSIEGYFLSVMQNVYKNVTLNKFLIGQVPKKWCKIRYKSCVHFFTEISRRAEINFSLIWIATECDDKLFNRIHSSENIILKLFLTSYVLSNIRQRIGLSVKKINKQWEI